MIARFVVFHQRLIRTLRRSQVFQHWFWSDPLRKTWSWSHILAGGVCSAAVGKMLQHTVFAWPLCFMFDYGLLVINAGDLLLQTFFARGITGWRILRVVKHKDQPQTKEWLMFFLSQDIPPTLIPFNPKLKKLKEYYVIVENVIWKSVILICCSQKWICLSSETTSIHYVCIHGMSNPAQVEWSSHLQLGESFQWLHTALLLGWWASPSTMNQWEFGPQARVFVISKFLHFYIFYLLNRSTGEMWSQSWHGSKKKWPNQYPKKPVWWRSGGGCVHTVAFSTPKLRKENYVGQSLRMSWASVIQMLF